MSRQTSELMITVRAPECDEEELNELTQELRAEIENLNVDAVENVSLGPAKPGTKAMDWASVGQMVVTLAPTVIPPLFAVVKSWIERKPSTPVRIRIKVGKKTAQIEYDPTVTSTKDLDDLVRTLGRSVKK